MSRNRFLSAVLIAAMALIASMFIVSVSSSDAFAKVPPSADVTVDFGKKHADLAQTVATAINENSGREGSDYSLYNEYGPLECTVNGNVISLKFPTSLPDKPINEGHVYSYFYNIIGANGAYDQGEQLLSVGKNTIDKYTEYSEIGNEFENAYTKPLVDKLSLNILWEKPVTKASFTVTNALCGTKVEIIEHPGTPDSSGYREQTPAPNVTAGEDSELILPTDEEYSENLWLNSISDLDPGDLSPDSDKCFQGTLTPETEVYVAICPMPKFGYFIDWESQMDITVNGEKAELLHLDDEIANPVVAKVTVTHDYGEWKKLNDAQHQKVCKHDPSHVLKENHKWDKGKVTKKATTTSKGFKTFTCTTCKATKTEAIPKLKPSKSVKTVSGKMGHKGKKALVLRWERVQGASGYDIFFARCNHDKTKKSPKLIKTIKGDKTVSWTKTRLNKGISYKAYVRAFVKNNGKKTYIAKTLNVHAYTGGGTKKYTNAKSVKVKNTHVKLTIGKTSKIKAKVIKLYKNKKLISTAHTPRLRYRTTNSKVATVNKKGVIRAKGTGECFIYVYAHNGISKKITVKVS